LETQIVRHRPGADGKIRPGAHAVFVGHSTQFVEKLARRQGIAAGTGSTTIVCREELVF